ncbi:MAG: SUMF1/EgtB/PvdO family nonheme iron enzyme [Deltaproteobacteria bacterium]|nr:SUMF1/EgtB/PvdO family nonheme iron enzyme [Deltaproteobacteria bacterium]
MILSLTLLKLSVAVNTSNVSYSAGAARISPVDGMTQVYVPAGAFTMGSSDKSIKRYLAQCKACKGEWFVDQKPQHQVTLDAFWIDKTEVTNAMFEQFVAATGYRTEGEILGSGIVFNQAAKDWRLVQGADWRHPQGPQSNLLGLDNHPVVHVTQSDAIAYCEWAGRRLPTEAEWEKAARCTDRREYPWGNEPVSQDRANFADRNLAIWSGNSAIDDGAVFTAPVGSYTGGASPYGVLDLAGNVSERVADRYGETYYAASTDHNPSGPWSREYVVTRGGSWSRAERYLQSTYRVRYYRHNRAAALGFRCAATALGAPETEEHVIFASWRSPVAPADLAAQLRVFLGRWEGFEMNPPVRKDLKIALFIEDIGVTEGKALVWMGTNLQFPMVVDEVSFRVNMHTSNAPEIEIVITKGGSLLRTTKLRFDTTTGELISPADCPRQWVLTRDRSFVLHGDYESYLAKKGITAKTYEPSSTWRIYGRGYLVYLPPTQKIEKERRWPLLLFLHGAGDRGDNILALAKASPFAMIREKGPLPFVIVAPLLSRADHLFTFSESYIDGVLELARKEYPIDPMRIYVTGLSLGGEATWRFALYRPNILAAIAPLAAFTLGNPNMISLRSLPVWAIHGANDTIIPVAMGQKPVAALRAASGNVQFSVLPDHDHDVWTDTYTDPKFYEWLLQHSR